MILKLVGVLQLILIQEISAQILARDLVIQNVLNNLENTQLAGCIRSRRQNSNPTVDLPGTGNLPVQGIANVWSFNFAQGNGSPGNLALNNGLPTSNMGLPNSSPISSMLYPFPNTNIIPQNRLLPNGNNNNGLPINNIPNSLQRFNNFPNELPGFNNIPNNLPPFNNNIPNGLTGFDNIPGRLPGVNNGPSGLPGFRNMPNGLPSFNNLPNELPSFNNVPNGLPGFNNIPSRLPGVNSIPNGLPIFNNNLPNELPSFNNIPNGLPGFNTPRGLPGVNNIPRAMPNFNIMLNGLPNNYNLPGTKNFQNFINVPAGNNILNSNNLPGVNSISNINNIPIATGFSSFNDFSCGIAYPVPFKNKMPPINNNLPLQNNLQITEIGLGNGLGDINRFPRNDQPNSNVLFNPNYLGNVNRLTHQGSNEFTNINGFPAMLYTPLITEVSNNAQDINRFSSVHNFPNINGVSNFAGEAENINMILLNKGIEDVSNFQNYNMMPVNAQSFASNIPFNNDFGAVNHVPANTVEQNANSRLIDAITNGIPLFNGGYLKDILFSNNAVNTEETHVQNGDANVISSNEVQFDNIQVPVDDLHYETVEANLPDTQIILPEGVHMITNVPSEYQPGLMSNSISLAKELVENLQIEGLKSMPFLNGLPVAGITETVTVLNR